LAALRSFVRYLEDWLGPGLDSTTRRILAILFKRYPKPMIGYRVPRGSAAEVNRLSVQRGATAPYGMLWKGCKFGCTGIHGKSAGWMANGRFLPRHHQAFCDLDGKK
jgi:hypothetical protein